MAPAESAHRHGRAVLHGSLVEDLGRRIVTGEIPVGDTLPTEERLVAAFGSSRSAVREATKVLTAKGLVRSRRKVGTVVQPESAWSLLDPEVLAWRYDHAPSTEQLDDLAQMRVVLEPEAARLAASSRDKAAVRAVRESYHRMVETIDDPDEFIAHDLAFHRAVIEAAGNQLLSHLHQVLEGALTTARQVHTRNVRRNKRTLPAHGVVLDAILARDPDQAAETMRALVTSAQHDIRRDLRRAARG